MSPNAARFETVRPGQHACLFYEDRTDQLTAVVSFIRNGLLRRERCVLLADPLSINYAKHGLSRAGIDVEREVERAALQLTSDREYLVNGRFDGAAMVAFLERAIAEAIDAGFTGLRGTGDVVWELGSGADLDVIQEYGASLSRLFRDGRLTGLCQYHRGAVPSRCLRRSLIAHNAVVLDQVVCADNPFYQRGAFGTDLANEQLEHDTLLSMCGELRRVAKGA